MSIEIIDIFSLIQNSEWTIVILLKGTPTHKEHKNYSLKTKKRTIFSACAPVF